MKGIHKFRRRILKPGIRVVIPRKVDVFGLNVKSRWNRKSVTRKEILGIREFYTTYCLIVFSELSRPGTEIETVWVSYDSFCCLY